ncbi:DUF2283 domain-containing protein [Candidatus Kaiserbacteria bacterium]|nr:DUF2283 domain-containing protein [Candidatus Kaiserbacteria bacterium]
MLKYFYDKEADIFYFSQGTPSAFDQTIEAGDDVLLRISPRTKRVRGFTLLNASRKTRNAPTGVPFTLVPNVSVRA